MKIVYSFNKTGFEAEFWPREIAAASDDRYTFIPFNHDPYVNVWRYTRAQLLDNLYFDRDAGLMRMYDDVLEVIARSGAEAMIVDNGFPYHPDWLRKQRFYKVLRTTDGPMGAYDRDIPYIHAYDHVLYHSPAHSRDLTMAQKLEYCGAKQYDFWPLAVFDANFDPALSEDELMRADRDIDILYIGAFLHNKMAVLAAVKKAFGRRAHLYGRVGLKANAYYNWKYRWPGWIRSVSVGDYVPLQQRAKIGINVHNRGAYTVGSYRMFDLSANGVMQICDGAEYLDSFFEPGKEIVGYTTTDELIDRIRHYLDHDDEREAIARNAYRRVMRDHRFAKRMRDGGLLIERGMQRAGRLHRPGGQGA